MIHVRDWKKEHGAICGTTEAPYQFTTDMNKVDCPACIEKLLYHVPAPDPQAVVWGVYRRKKRAGRGNLFRLTTACLRRETAIKQALALLQQDGDGYQYNIQSSRAAAPLPDRFDP